MRGIETVEDLQEAIGTMRDASLSTPDLDPEVHTLMLADLGQKVLNAVAATKQLGHTRLQHTLRYMHTVDPAALLVMAVIDGSIDGALGAVARWHSEAPKITRAVIAAARRSA